MPNWCYTNMTIEGSDVKNLHDKITEWQEEGTQIENSWGNSWLGLLVEKGLNEEPCEGKYNCRGCFNIESFDDNLLQISTETAWSPMMDMWFDLVDRYCPGSQLTYTAEESGMGIYVTNDADLIGKYYIDSWDEKVESMWDATEDNVRNIVAELTDSDVSNMSIDELIEFCYDEDFDISINAWDYWAA